MSMLINSWIVKSPKFEIWTELKDNGTHNVTIETYDNITLGMTEDQAKTLCKALIALLKGEDRPQPRRERGSSKKSAPPASKKEEKDPWDE